MLKYPGRNIRDQNDPGQYNLGKNIPSQNVIDQASC